MTEKLTSPDLSCPEVCFKGSREGLRLVLPEAEFAAIYAAVEEQLRRAGGFFRGGRVILDSRRRLLPDETTALTALLAEYGLTVKIPEEETSFHSLPFIETATAVRAPVRSGQCLEVEGTLLVLGDIHPGAEVRAGRDVIVLGTARGVISAGLISGREARVFAFSLRPSLLRLGDLMARSPARGPAWRPEIAWVQEDRIVVEPFRGWQRVKTGRTRD